MRHPNKTTVVAFLISSAVAGGATLSVREANAKNFRAAASLCTPTYFGYFNANGEVYNGGDFTAGDASEVLMMCPLLEFSDWNRQVATELEVVFKDNTASDGVYATACRSNFFSETDSCGSFVGDGANSNTPGWTSVFPDVTGVNGVWDDTTLGTAYIQVYTGHDCVFDGYIIKDVNG